MRVLYSDKVVTHDGLKPAYIMIENGKITNIVDIFSGEYEDFTGAIIMPGFIDQHTHGWGRGSFLYENNEKSLRMMIEDQAKEGVTSFLATTFTDSISSIHQSIDACNTVINNQNPGTELLGLHIEGPFINKEFKGAQKEEYCLEPDTELMKSFVERCVNKNQIKLITLAPELPNAQELVEYCVSENIQVAAGHTGASFEEIQKSVAWGVGGVTHMFSAMTGLHHREPGVAGAALYNPDLMCEFAKQTGITVRHEVFDITYRIKGPHRIIMTTDCLGNGMQKEPYYHARRNVHFIPQGDIMIERHADGSEIHHDLNDYNSIRNIEMSFIDSIKNMKRHTDIGWEDLALITSTNSAKYIHVDDRKGSIAVGKDADFTIITPEVDLVETIVKGISVHKVEA